MELSDEDRIANEIELEFIEYLHNHAVSVTTKEFLIHQQGFFNGLKAGNKDLDLSSYFQAIQNRKPILPVHWLQQFVLEYVYNDNIITLQLLQIRRNARKPKYNAKTRKYFKKNRNN